MTAGGDLFSNSTSIHIDKADYSAELNKIKSVRSYKNRPFRVDDVIWNFNRVPNLLPGFAYVYVDFKYHRLEPGELACVPGWHLDGYNTPPFPADEAYHLIWSYELEGEPTKFNPEQLPGTEFLTKTQEFDLSNIKNDSKSHHRYFAENLLTLDPEHVIMSQPGHWYRYNNHTFHRGTTNDLDVPVIRRFCRIRQTNRKFIREERNFKPTYWHSVKGLR